MSTPFEKFELRQTLSLGRYILITEPHLGESVSFESVKADVARMEFIEDAIREKVERQAASGKG